MSIKDKILRGTDANLHVSFDVGHSSIGWAVLEKTGTQASDIKINGCGSVVFRADDCLASSRRAYRRQRRHIRSTRQRIERIARLLAHLLANEKSDKAPELVKRLQIYLNSPSQDRAKLQGDGDSAPWKLAAQILQGGKSLTWPELWDVLRWYAHNRGYDGNQRWSNNSEVETEAAELDDAALDKILKDASATEDEKKDAEKVIEAKNLMRRHGVRTMAETFCKELGIDPKGEKKSSMKRFKGLNAAFPRKIVETEVLQILQAHKFCDAKFIHLLLAKKLSDEDRAFLKSAGIRIPKRYEGGLLFGQLVPRFDNRIISTCPITYHQIFEEQIKKTGDLKTAKHIAKKLSKVPSRNCPEFLNFRWAILLANIKVARPGEKELTPLTIAERKTIDSAMREKGSMTEGELKKAVREVTGATRDKLDQMFMEELDAKKALILDPVQELITSNGFAPFWNLLKIGDEKTPEHLRLQKRLRGQWRRGKNFSLAQIRKQLESLGGGVSLFDAELQRQLDTQNVKAKKKDKQITGEQLLQKRFPAHPIKLDGRAPFARHLLNQAYEDVLAGKPHPTKENGGCLFRSEEIRRKELNRKIDEQTNNHLVRHRLLILERVLNDIIKEYADGKKERIGKITIEVNRDLREMSGMDSIAKKNAMRDKLGNIRAVEKYVLDRLPENYHGRVKGNFLRKARVADDLNWRCPYTGEMIQPIHLMTGIVDLDHIIPYSIRPSNSLDSLVVTFSVINKMKGKRTAMQFMKKESGEPVCFINEKGKEERIDGMPNLALMQLKDFKTFIGKLKIRGPGEHEQDKARRLRRKELLEKETWEEKTFLPRDLTQTSQLVRLGAQVLRKNLPHLTTGDVTSLPGSVTGTVRKAWKVLGCLSLANPQVLDENGDVKNKTDIRDITHLHHALDACVLGLSSHFIPKDGRVWELIVKRNPDDLERRQLEALGVFGFNAENRFEMHDLDSKLKEQICQRLAEKRVVQHIPARMDGLRVEQNVWGITPEKSEDGLVVIQQKIRQPDGSRKKKKVPEKKVKLLGLTPANDVGKLAANKGVLVIPDNYGVAILDHAKDKDDKFVIIPWHLVHTRIFKGFKDKNGKVLEKSLVERNGGKMPRILRNGQIIRVKAGTYKDKGAWKITSIKNQKSGIKVNLAQPDTVNTEVEVFDEAKQKKMRKVRDDCKHEASLETIVSGGLEILNLPLTGFCIQPPEMKEPKRQDAV